MQRGQIEKNKLGKEAGHGDTEGGGGEMQIGPLAPRARRSLCSGHALSREEMYKCLSVRI